MISLESIRKAAENCSGKIKETPLVESAELGKKIKGKAFLKCENLQAGGSFKIRGVIQKLASLTAGEKEKGIIASSAGNFGIALAGQCKEQGIPLTVVVPKGIARIKIEKLKGKGIEIIEHGSVYDDAEREAKRLASMDGRAFISPYNDDSIIAGNGTIALEILGERPETDTIISAASGGALVSGLGIAAKGLKPKTAVFGVQSSAAPSFYESVKAGKPVQAEERETIAESLRGSLEEGSVTLEYAKKFVDGILLVEEGSIKEAMRFLWKEHSLRTEGAGAVGVALLLEQPERFSGRNVAVVLSGGNVDLHKFMEIVEG